MWHRTLNNAARRRRWKHLCLVITLETNFDDDVEIDDDNDDDDEEALDDLQRGIQ